MFVKIIHRHFVFNQEKHQVCNFRIYRHFVKSVNGSNFPVYNGNLVIFPRVGAFQQLFGPVRGRFLTKNFQKFKCPEGFPGGGGDVEASFDCYIIYDNRARLLKTPIKLTSD